MAVYPHCSPQDYIHNTSFYQAEGSPVTKGIILSLLSIFAIIAIVGNILAIIVVYRNRSLHDPSGILLAGLASADLAVGTVGILTSVLYQWLNGYIISESSCAIRGYLMTVFIGTSHSIVAMIAVDRCIAISKPLHYRLYVTNKRTFQIIILNLLVTAIVAALPLTGLQDQSLGRYEFVHYLSGCWLDITNHPQNFTLSMLISICVICILLTIITAYIIILFEAKRIDNNLVLLKSSLKERRRWLRKSTRTILILIGVYLLCTIPSTTFTLFATIYCKPIASPLAYKILIHWGIYINTVINPFLFGFTHKDFRQGYRLVFLHFSLIGTRVSRVHITQ